MPPSSHSSASSALADATLTTANPAWHGGQILAFSALDGQTDFAAGLVARTSFGQPGLEIRLPATARLRFDLPAARVINGGDHLLIGDADRELRAVFVDAWHLLVVGPTTVLEMDGALRCATAPGRLLIGAAERFDADLLQRDLAPLWQARQAWLQHQSARFRRGPERRDHTLHQALRLMKGQVCSPEGRIRRRWTTPDRWPHRGMWLWDSAFHAIGWRHVDPALAREMIDAVFDCQAADGFLPHFATPSACSAITQPPVLALAASRLQASAPDRDWLARLYPKLAGYLRWDLDHRDRDRDGLLEWYIEADPHCRSGESGMDNSVRFDSATALAATDFNAYLCLECELLAGFAQELGYSADARAWQVQAQALRQRIRQRLWSAEHAFFLDYDPVRGRHSGVLASAGFMPLICGAADDQQLAALLRHLDAPASFGSPTPLPSVATRDPGFGTDMWRGPMWVCTNWLVAYGLARYGEHGRARRLRHATVAEIERQHAAYGIFYEYYDAMGRTPPPRLMRKGQCPPPDSLDPFPHQVIHDFGWTATLYLDMVLDDPL